MRGSRWVEIAPCKSDRRLISRGGVRIGVGSRVGDIVIRLKRVGK